MLERVLEKSGPNNFPTYKIGLYDFNFLGRGEAGFYQNNDEDTYSINFRAKQWLEQMTDLNLQK